ncbi:hypothetical protein MTo_02188 [Microcystis aeruginosa NIES-1211]|uniref:Uncharacterized protein n=1 Tax=Microcystis aeruginosa NIES-2519 TaxID=2303981 RepID=A0A5A5RC43_MICAE|nr:hypothetical protein MTo_02188 [Microcystis aeruginosa NIES-1211]GCA72389.1 hypothetical protein MiYa_03940 [Microcystis aeruginosa NIES-2519]GCA83922.1 hypothetical protein MiHa_01891 [Microcystis aeruginosa NIES-2522]
MIVVVPLIRDPLIFQGFAPTHEIQFYLSSLPDYSPRIALAIRLHWGIENS